MNAKVNYLIVEPLAAGGAVRQYTRAQALRLIWKHTHRDFRGTPSGVKCILVLRSGGTWSVPLAALTDAEVEGKLAYADGAEKRRLAKVKSVTQVT